MNNAGEQIEKGLEMIHDGLIKARNEISKMLRKKLSPECNPSVSCKAGRVSAKNDYHNYVWISVTVNSHIYWITLPRKWSRNFFPI